MEQPVATSYGDGKFELVTHASTEFREHDPLFRLSAGGAFGSAGGVLVGSELAMSKPDPSAKPESEPKPDADPGSEAEGSLAGPELVLPSVVAGCQEVCIEVAVLDGW